MNTDTLPPLPERECSLDSGSLDLFTAGQMESYARAAIAAHVPEAGCGNIAALAAVPAQPSAKLTELIAGALYDLMGDLTTRDETLRLGAFELATPACDALDAFAKKRGLSLDNPAIENWSTQLATAQPPAPTAQPAYVDSTPHLNVGNSAFEHWFQAQPFATQPGIKQISRDSYAAGMGDPLVMAKAAQPVQQPTAESDDVLQAAGLLEAMARNYAGGHSWDHLDGKACLRAAEMLRKLLLAAPAERQPLSEEQLKRALNVNPNGSISNTVRAIAKDVQAGCAAAWGVTLATAKGEKQP